MSQSSGTPFKELYDSIIKVLEISKTELCALHFYINKNGHFATFHLPDGGNAECIAIEDDGRIFAGASLFKIFIATAVSLVVEKLSVSSDPTNKYHRLQDAWDRVFTEVFNECSKGIQIKPLCGNPTVRDLLFHYKGPYDINHLFFAPDGSPLLSRDTFLSKISQYTWETRQRHDGIAWCEYSNANYILVGLLIEVVSGTALHAFLKEHIFERLGMHRTYMTAEELSSVPIQQRAQPHVVSSSGHRRIIASSTIPYLADTVELATMGGFTCAADVGMFFTAVLGALDRNPINDEFDETFVRSLFKGLGSIGGQGYGYTRFGLYTELHQDLPGSHSLNRLIKPDSKFSTYTLGKRLQDKTQKAVQAYYMAGSITGGACTAYFLPTYDMFVVVLTNTSGPLDASDIISKLCLQELLHLRPSKADDRKFIFRPEGSDRMTLAETNRAHYIELADGIYKENAAEFRKLEDDDKIPDTPTADCPAILGTYCNEMIGQSIEVFDWETESKKNVLRVIIKGESKSSKLMRLVRKGRVFRMCSLPRQDGFPDLAIDCFGAWRNLEFEFEEKNGVIMCLSREGLYLTDRFTRKAS